MSYTTDHWAVRKIRNGRVKICGIWYKPDDRFMPYDGRLDGMTYAFGRYVGDPSMVSMWGRKELWRVTEDLEEFMALLEKIPEPDVVDGTHPWAFWFATEEGL